MSNKAVSLCALERKAARIRKCVRLLSTEINSMGEDYFNILDRGTSPEVFRHLFNHAKAQHDRASDSVYKLSELAVELEDDLHEVAESFGINQQEKKNERRGKNERI